MAGFNWIVLLIGLVFAALAITVSIFVTIYWTHDEEAWGCGGVFVRIVVTFALAISLFIPMLVPMDVVYQGTTSDINDIQTNPFSLIWEVVMYVVLISAFLFLPFVYFYWETREDAKTCKSITCGFFKTIAAAIVILVLALCLFFFVGKAVINADTEFPMFYSTYIKDNYPNVGTLSEFYDSAVVDTILKSSADVNSIIETKTTFEVESVINVSFIVYLMGLASLIGSVLFTIFAAIGVSSLPWGFINSFRTRPRLLDQTQRIAQKTFYAKSAKELIIALFQLESKMINNLPPSDHSEYDAIPEKDIDGDKKRLRILLNCPRNKKIKKDYYMAERGILELESRYKEVMCLNTKDKQKDYKGALKYVWNLVAGVIFMLVSLVWVAQLCSVCFGKYDFLGVAANYCAKQTDFPLFSVIFYCIFNIYITFCLLSGVTKFGFRFIFFISIHPMEKGKTFLNSFLFNMILMVLCTIPVIQFCSLVMPAFSDASATDILFSKTMSNLLGFMYWFNYQHYVFLAIFAIAFIFFIFYKGKKWRDELKIEKDKHGEATAKLVKVKAYDKKPPSMILPIEADLFKLKYFKEDPAEIALSKTNSKSKTPSPKQKKEEKK